MVGRQWASSFLALVRGTAGLWWTLLPRLVAILTVSWTVSRVLQLAAAAVGIMVPSQQYDIDLDARRFNVNTIAVWNQWLAVVLVSLSLLALLVGLIMCLRAVDDAHQVVADGADRPSLFRTLSLTLLAFLGIYSVFDQVGAIVNSVIGDAIVLNRDPGITLFTPLMPDTWQATVLVVGVIAAAFVLRRFAEQRADKTGNRGLGLLSAVLESFYLFAFFIVGRGLLLRLRSWLVYRNLSLWEQDALTWLGTPFQWLKLELADLLGAAWNWFWDIGWPVVLSSFLQPLLWLALATLVLGSGIRTFAELLENGHLRAAASRRARGGRVATRVAESMERHGRTVGRVQDVVLGDVDDKYLPLWHALRLTLSSGIGFLGAFVVVFALIDLAQAWATLALNALVGPHDYATEMFFGDFANLIVYVVFMSLRLCLLATAHTLAFHASDRAGVTS